MTERGHCEAVADEWVRTVETHRRIYGRESLVAGLADLIARERAAARAEALAGAAEALRDALWPTTVGGEYARRCALVVEKLR